MKKLKESKNPRTGKIGYKGWKEKIETFIEDYEKI